MKKLILIFLMIHCSLTIVHSQSNWYWQNPLPTGYDLNKIKYLDSSTGFAVGRKGSIAKTTDSGSIKSKDNLFIILLSPYRFI